MIKSSQRMRASHFSDNGWLQALNPCWRDELGRAAIAADLAPTDNRSVPRSCRGRAHATS